jgi:hypothetical protein
MPECECCGETEDKIYKCKRCGTNFCQFCGSPMDKLCIECLDEEEYDEDYEEVTYFDPSTKAQRSMYRIE